MVKIEAAGLSVGVSPALKQRRLAALLAVHDPGEAALRAAVEEAQVRGSLELAGTPLSPEQVRAARVGQAAPAAARGMFLALRAVEAAAPFSRQALARWHAAALGSSGAVRAGEQSRPEGPPPAPAAFVEARLAVLEQWLAMESARELAPSQIGALVMARLLEILPFDTGNGVVARLAASHLMRQRGARAPILRGGDRERLDDALRAAFDLETAALCALLEEASDRALDVMLEALQGR